MKDKEIENHSRRLFIKRSTGAVFASTLGLGLVATRQTAYASGSSSIPNLLAVLGLAYHLSCGQPYEQQTRNKVQNYLSSGSADQEANSLDLAIHLLNTVGMGSGLLSGFCTSGLADALSDALDDARATGDVPTNEEIEEEAQGLRGPGGSD